MEQYLAVKKQLFQKCQEYVQKRISTIKEAMSAIKEAADEETKSSAGDKYETGRAMMQIEMENYANQLAEARKLQSQMDQLPKPNTVCKNIESGCLAVTSQGNYYFAVSVGKITIDDKDYFAVAPSSPVGGALLGLKAGETAELNGRKIEVKEVY
ncbi:MAG: 3-oxoacyl-ACP synthase [Candidatus Cyclobacteriaceae bacterium M2_1C_046]